MEPNLLDRKKSGDDIVFEQSLRPATFDQYFGQTKVKENLKIYVDATKQRGEPLDHVLLHGPPGLGKTSLAYIIANELNVGIKTTSGPAIEKPGDLAAILNNLSPGDVLFIDEIHRLSRIIEEILYPAMEDYHLDLIIGQGPTSRSIKISLAPFTLIGATTRIGLLSAPLRDRFGITSHLELYDPEELQSILRRSSRILNIPIEEDCIGEIADRSRGTPRIANRLLKRLRDYADVLAEGRISPTVVNKGLTMMEIDHRGLDPLDRKILRVIIEKFNGGPVGIETIATAVNEERGTIEDVYEPYLIQCGFIQRTPRGRVAASEAYRYLSEIGKTLANQ